MKSINRSGANHLFTGALVPYGRYEVFNGGTGVGYPTGVASMSDATTSHARAKRVINTQTMEAWKQWRQFYCSGASNKR